MIDELTGERVQTAETAQPSAAVLVARVLVMPRSSFERVAEQGCVAWPYAIGLIAFAGALVAAVAAGFTMRRGGPAHVVAAVAVRYGSLLTGPLVFAFAAAGLLVLMQRMWRGDATYSQLLSVVALSLMPLVLRDLIQAGYMIATHTVLMHPGLSALVAPPASSAVARVTYSLLGQLDAFSLWSFVLLTLAAHTTRGRGWVRPLLATAVVAGLGTLAAAVASFAVAVLLTR